MHPVLPASPDRAASAAPGGPLAAVTHELARVLTTPAADLASASAYFEAAEALKSVRYRAAGTELKNIAATGPMSARLWALNVLVAISPPDEREGFALGQVAELQATLFKAPADLDDAVYWLAESMDGRFRSRAATRVLAPLLGSSSAAVRRASAATLSRIATPDVIAPLARVALNDPERDVRFFAVQGLAWANKQQGPSKSAFESDEAALLQQWREWSRNNVR
jgi:HEAT repeat protein